MCTLYETLTEMHNTSNETSEQKKKVYLKQNLKISGIYLYHMYKYTCNKIILLICF